MMNRTRLSLFYFGSCLAIIGFGPPLAPQGTLTVLQSKGDYGDIFPRVVGLGYLFSVCFILDPITYTL
jgi:hypothetical protein